MNKFIKFSDRYRLAIKEDMFDPKVIIPLVIWYKEFHRKRKIYNKIKETRLILGV